MKFQFGKETIQVYLSFPPPRHTNFLINYKMKYIFLLFPVFLFGQIKAELHVDEMEGSKSAKTEFVRFKNDYGIVDFSLFKSDKDLRLLYMQYSIRGIECFSRNRSFVKIKLADDSILDMVQLSDTECADYGTVYFVPLSEEESKMDTWKDIIRTNYEKLTSQEWKLIRIYSTKGYFELKPEATRKNESPQTFFIDAAESIESVMK